LIGHLTNHFTWIDLQIGQRHDILRKLDSHDAPY
jgi:hypothetical protein